jgi:hypothetical protein
MRLGNTIGMMNFKRAIQLDIVLEYALNYEEDRLIRIPIASFNIRLVVYQ